ncbi:methionine--tRNA ligase [Bacteroidia bacterium]|nr:methionine--tRNA ligase [Bacteroidia bacterium]MDB9882027.1 methionine--tRNA ligase [Bacteroidia bacterium]
MPKRHLITCALPYANGPIHIGHIAGCFLPSDIYNRFLRMQGKDVLFVCGSDEHGVPITLKAKKEGKTPQGVVDENHAVISKALKDFDIRFDTFSRTTNQLHHETAQDFFKNLYDKGVFIEEVSEQFYDEEAGEFLADKYIVGTCPSCGNQEATANPCEKCNRNNTPQDLINPRSALTDSKPILKETKNWYLPLDKIQEDFLNDWVDTKKSDWKPSVYGQCNSWLKEGLKPRAMTRDLNWGVDVPIKDAEGKVMYVWFDAPIGYITATKEAAGEDWEKWWTDSETELTHFLGKDNIVFHTIIFPAMLQEHGDFILPTNMPANEFLNLEGEKISTSKNHAIWLHEYLEDFPGKTDELRYTLTSILPETKDADFTWKDYQAKVNNELVAILGNFVNRVIVLSNKYYDGIVPVGSLQLNSTETLNKIESSLQSFNQRQGLENYMEIARSGNKYLQETEPWKLIKYEANAQAVADCLYTCIQIVKEIGEYAQIFLPETSKKLLNLLNIKSFDGEIKAGHQLGEASLLFEKIEDEMIENQMAKLHKTKEEMTEVSDAVEVEIAELKPEITYDDFIKMDLRVGTITAAEKVKKADRLLHITLDIGTETRSVVSGIAEHFAPDDIIGQQVTYLANLAPRKLRGIESSGMILMAEDTDGSLKFVAPSEQISSGSGIT